MNYRSERVSKLFREKLAKIIACEIETPGALATITDIDVDKKLEHARIGISVIPETKGKETFTIFREMRRKLQYLLMEKVQIKPFPKIEFFLDNGNKHAARVEKLLIQEENE